MKNSLKGAIAAGAAAVLLLGGAGTLAYWNAAETIEGGTITAGSLTLDAFSCDGWVYAEDNARAGEAVALIVPGDTVSKDCTFVVGATGDNLSATLEVPETAIITGADDTTLESTITPTYTLGGSPITGTETITEANDGQAGTATIAVEFPFGDTDTINTNTMQNVVATLNDIQITLTQVDANL